MRPSDALHRHRHHALATLARFPVANPRIFGSTLLGTDGENSDLDLLVDPLPSTTLLDLGALQDELENLLQIRVDVRTPKDLPMRFRAEVLASAKPL